MVEPVNPSIGPQFLTTVELELLLTTQEAIPTFGLDPPYVLRALHHGAVAQLYRALTFPWFHVVLPHLVVNMLALIDTGARLELAIGTTRFVLVLASILVGQAALLLAAFAAFPRCIYPNREIRRESDILLFRIYFRLPSFSRSPSVLRFLFPSRQS